MKHVNLLAMIIMVVGLIMYILMRELFAVYTFGFGALVFTIQRLVLVFNAKSNQTKISRIPQIKLLSAIALLGAAYLMYDASNSWSVLLLVSAVLEIYISYRES